MPNDQSKTAETPQPRVSLTWKDRKPCLLVDGVDLTNVARAGSARIELPARAGDGDPVIHFALRVHDLTVDGVGVEDFQ